MRRTIRKWFWAWNFDKEEKWLNEMSAKGLQLCTVGFFRYDFEQGLPGEYIYRLEYLDNPPSHAESVRYIQFVEDTGVEHIGSFFRWMYFRKKADGTGFDLFSDIDSRIKHLNRMLFLMGILSGANLINGLIRLSSWLSGDSSLFTTIICLFAGGLIGYGFLRTFLKWQGLKKEKILRE